MAALAAAIAAIRDVEEISVQLALKAVPRYDIPRLVDYYSTGNPIGPGRPQAAAARRKARKKANASRRRNRHG
jgi:hypothetical protein